MNNTEMVVEKFKFICEWPPEVLLAVRESIDGLGWLVPPWCHEVLLTWNDEEDGCAAVSIEYDYRTARIQVMSGFLSDPAPQRRHHMRHELLHLFTNVPFIYAESVIERLLGGDDNSLHREQVLSDLRERHESAVCDLEYCLREAGI